jgi:hypothetical protein
MSNVKVVILSPSTEVLDSKQLTDKLQASTGERKHINTEEVNKQR